MATFAQLKANLQAALNKGNAKTGANDTSITACIDRLIASSGASSTPTEGLAYTVLENGTYQCDGKGTATDRSLVIGGAIDGFPITTLKANAFQGAGGFTKLTILDTITAIPSTCFGGSWMTELQLSCMLTSIGPYAFYSTQIAEVTIPPLVVDIQNVAFANSPKLTKVTFKGTPTLVVADAFKNCTALTDIYVPWAENALNGAPWGATNATIHYNS